eukprot:CAMPEP_0170453956 /NCGR_PEP_ID=MMETSP0123-20130129/2373_1 /TAXON_ID=182087 /ORGANISM="Favella ehrenbergii, Strain Fehren 1" /LENGTH=219 /DNA_ID=CAMNT_0010716517 /DNA_START=327 /DNA_END=986 /DNA_ORIENTATION=-
MAERKRRTLSTFFGSSQMAVLNVKQFRMKQPDKQENEPVKPPGEQFAKMNMRQRLHAKSFSMLKKRGSDLVRKQHLIPISGKGSERCVNNPLSLDRVQLGVIDMDKIEQAAAMKPVVNHNLQRWAMLNKKKVAASPERPVISPPPDVLTSIMIASTNRLPVLGKKKPRTSNNNNDLSEKKEPNTTRKQFYLGPVVSKQSRRHASISHLIPTSNKKSRIL